MRPSLRIAAALSVMLALVSFVHLRPLTVARVMLLAADAIHWKLYEFDQWCLDRLRTKAAQSGNPSWLVRVAETVPLAGRIGLFWEFRRCSVNPSTARAICATLRSSVIPWPRPWPSILDVGDLEGQCVADVVLLANGESEHRNHLVRLLTSGGPWVSIRTLTTLLELPEDRYPVNGIADVLVEELLSNRDIAEDHIEQYVTRLRTSYQGNWATLVSQACSTPGSVGIPERLAYLRGEASVSSIPLWPEYSDE